MSRTDSRRRSRRPEHADEAPRYQRRPEPRRGRTRSQAVRLAMKEV